MSNVNKFIIMNNLSQRRYMPETPGILSGIPSPSGPTAQPEGKSKFIALNQFKIFQYSC